MYRSSYNRFTPYWENLPEVNDVGEEKKRKTSWKEKEGDNKMSKTRPAAVIFFLVFWCVCVASSRFPSVRSVVSHEITGAHKRQTKTSPETHKNFSHVVTWGGGPSISTFSFRLKTKSSTSGRENEMNGQFVGSLGPLYVLFFSSSFCFSSQKLCWPLFVRGFQQQKRIPNKSLTDLVFLFRFLLRARF